SAVAFASLRVCLALLASGQCGSMSDWSQGGDRMSNERQRGRQRAGIRAAVVTASAALVSGLCMMGVAGSSAASAHPASKRHDHQQPFHLGHGVKHIVQLGFDNVHFFRDNPNVPSDLEMMPNLVNFFESNGTFLSNNHTPLIAHTAVDLLTTATGLYG